MYINCEMIFPKVFSLRKSLYVPSIETYIETESAVLVVT